MPVREFLNNVSFLLAVMALGALVETAVPLFVAMSHKRPRRLANMGLTLVTFLSNWALASVAAVAALTLRPSGLLARWGWPAWAEIIAGVVVLDFCNGYLAHWTMHRWPPMWRFHRIHHSDAFVDVTTTFRTHPVESVWRFVFGIVPVWALGLPAEAVVIQRLLQAGNGVIEHANIRLWAGGDRCLSLFWVTPNVHKMHHSRDVAETNSNYANILTLYDRLLGTYTPSARAASVVYGLDDAPDLSGASLPTLVTTPFQAPARDLPDRNVRIEAGLGR